MEERENFGRYIKEKRKAAGLSQKELATQLNEKCDKMLDEYTVKADQIFDSVLGRLK